MWEFALVAVFVAMAIITIGGKNMSTAGVSTESHVAPIGDGSDLPCPWCQAQTNDADRHCPSCGHRFG